MSLTEIFNSNLRNQLQYIALYYSIRFNSRWQNDNSYRWKLMWWDFLCSKKSFSWENIDPYNENRNNRNNKILLYMFLSTAVAMKCATKIKLTINSDLFFFACKINHMFHVFVWQIFFLQSSLYSEILDFILLQNNCMC